MKSNLFFFAGLFAALLVSWLGIVIGSNAQLGSLAPYYDDNDGSTHPEWLAGVAAQGQLVYRDLGCIACHTQQVRRPSFGSDQARGWGDRQSVARDYIYQPSPQLGLSRVGPDLTNVGDRKPPFDSGDFLNLLYSGANGMPSYRFLFEARQIGAEAQPSDNALKLTGSLRPPNGWEVVPTTRAVSLVGYLLNLKTTYNYPEAAPFVPPKPEGERGKPVAPAPGAAPASQAAPAPQAPAPAVPAPQAAPAPAAPAPGAAPASQTAPAPQAPAPAVPAPQAAPVPAAAPSGVAAPPAAPTPAGTTQPPAPAGSEAPAAKGPTAAPAPPAAPQAAAPAAGNAGPSPTPSSAQPAASTVPPAAPAQTPPATTPPAGTGPTPSPTGGSK
jgi:cytochrome c oxidase cbb3-type subunit 2